MSHTRQSAGRSLSAVLALSLLAACDKDEDPAPPKPSVAAPVAPEVKVPPTQPADSAPPVEAPTADCPAGQRRVHDVVIEGLGDKVMGTIAKVREITQLPLHEVSDLARLPGAVVAPGLAQTEAEATLSVPNYVGDPVTWDPISVAWASGDAESMTVEVLNYAGAVTGSGLDIAIDDVVIRACD